MKELTRKQLSEIIDLFENIEHKLMWTQLDDERYLVNSIRSHLKLKFENIKKKNHGNSEDNAKAKSNHSQEIQKPFNTKSLNGGRVLTMDKTPDTQSTREKINKEILKDYETKDN